MTASDEPRGRLERETRLASRLRTVLIAVGILALNVAGVAVLLSPYGFDDGFDPYDDASRAGVSFGQRGGPDGDTCWPENSRNYSGTLYCDLVSIGGLHWDTGDVKVVAGSPFSIEIAMGSGFMCMIDEDRAPWCWEWSSETQPRTARVPQDAQFDSIVPGGGFVCGQTTDFVTVVCWTVGVGRSRYRQATHRPQDHSEWALYPRLDDDPPSFVVRPRLRSGHELRIHAFSGSNLTRLRPDVTLQWETETVP
ncbi:hypothetical protein [Candidatus Poriferisodalis sp.]|uniref:hypothetical protein n=1 Tax=Candidatus Poriferisodalis sp. TaxID=3101277 RepID=UPI003B01CBCA